MALRTARMISDVATLQNELQAMRHEKSTVSGYPWRLGHILYTFTSPLEQLSRAKSITMICDAYLQTQERIELYSYRGRGRGRGRGSFPGRAPPQQAQENPEASEGAGRGLSASLRDRLGSREGSEKPAGPKTRRDEHDHRYSRQELNERRYNRQFYGDNIDGVEEQEPQVCLLCSESHQSAECRLKIMFSIYKQRYLQLNAITFVANCLL